MRHHLSNSSILKMDKTYETLEKFNWEDVLHECSENLPLLTCVLKGSMTTSHKQSYVEMYEIIYDI